MRRTSSLPLPAPPDRAFRGDWHTVRTLLPYLLAYKSRAFLPLACLVAAKLANVGVPLVLKQIVDRLTAPTELVLPLALLVAYGAMRLSTTAFTELREFLFAKVTQRAVRTIALRVFRHLHALSLRFHLSRQTGGLTRDVERGTRGITTLVSFARFSILPTLGVVDRTMTIGDLVLVNAFMIQLYIPLNFLGVLYREIKQALADMERMFHLIEEYAEVKDAPGAGPLAITNAEVRFEHVDFS